VSVRPSLRLERSLLRAGHNYVGGIDEVGRGPLAGPIVVGLVVVSAETPAAPQGVRDSKATKRVERPNLVTLINEWAWSTTASVDAQFIDTFGLTAALRECVTIAIRSAVAAGISTTVIRHWTRMWCCARKRISILPVLRRRVLWLNLSGMNSCVSGQLNFRGTAGSEIVGMEPRNTSMRSGHWVSPRYTGEVFATEYLSTG
jgi:hypothetical protein